MGNFSSLRYGIFHHFDEFAVFVGLFGLLCENRRAECNRIERVLGE